MASAQTTDAAEPKTADEWARTYVTSDSFAFKTQPPKLPSAWDETPPDAVDLRPSRPSPLEVTLDRPKSVKLNGLRDFRVRARLVHKFWHHELQAAELMCWAVARFPETPREFKRGLLRIARDEIRHMGLYEEHIRQLGYQLGDFPVRDWFWERVASCQTPLAFVSFIGMGLEAANLEHTERFQTWFEELGDDYGVKILDQIAKEEVAHVRFATRWFKEWTGGVDFDDWCKALPPPITPLLLRGKSLRLDLRRKAEMPEEFLDRLASWEPS